MGADAWMGLLSSTPPSPILKGNKIGAWGCAHHHVAPRGAHSVVLGRQHKKQHKNVLEKGV